MSVEIKFGGSCRDVEKLPSSEAELRSFFMDIVAPQMWVDFSKNVATARSAYRELRPINIAVTERGCEIGGEIIIRL